MSGRLKHAEWLQDEALAAVFVALGRGNCRVVGGAVRDNLMGRDVADIDLATTLPPEVVIERLQEAGLKAVPTGLAHGTITAVSGGRGFEVTTLRHDVETDGRHAEVAFHSDWEADAARRDFTINAIYAEADGTLHDYFDGEADAVAGRVRFIGDAAARIDEDALRILRFFRMQAWFGKGTPDADGLAACAAAIDKLDILSVERVRDELLKLLAAVDPCPMLAVMTEIGVMAHILPEMDSPEGLPQLIAVEAALKMPDRLRRLAVLLVDDSQMLRNTARRLRLSNADTARLAMMGEDLVAPDMTDAEMRRIIYHNGKQTVTDRLILTATPDNKSISEVRRGLQFIEAFDVPALPVGGADLAALGMAEGPEMGDQLRALEAAWIDSDFTLNRVALLARI